MRTIYALADPAEPDCIQYVGTTAEDPDRLVATRSRHIPPKVRDWLDQLAAPPIVRVLEVADVDLYEAKKLCARWVNRLKPRPAPAPPKPPPPPKPQRLCAATSVTGEPCRLAPLTNGTLCQFHRRTGPGRPQISAARLTDAERKAVMNLGTQWVPPPGRNDAPLPGEFGHVPLPPEPSVEPEIVTVVVPPLAVTAAIQLRTMLYPYEEIASRLTKMGQPPGHHWTPGEARHLIASAFYA